MTEKLVGILEDSTLQIKAQITATGPRGPQGEQGPKGDKGDSIEFAWIGTHLGVRVEGETGYRYVNLKGDKGDRGKDLDFIWDGTRLGVKVEGDATYQYRDLKGEKGDPGTGDGPIVDLGTFDSPEQLIGYAVMNQLPTGCYTFFMYDYSFFMLLEQESTFYRGTFHASDAIFHYFKVSIYGEIIELKQIDLRDLMTDVQMYSCKQL